MQEGITHRARRLLVIIHLQEKISAVEKLRDRYADESRQRGPERPEQAASWDGLCAERWAHAPRGTWRPASSCWQGFPNRAGDGGSGVGGHPGAPSRSLTPSAEASPGPDSPAVVSRAPTCTHDPAGSSAPVQVTALGLLPLRHPAIGLGFPTRCLLQGSFSTRAGPVQKRRGKQAERGRKLEAPAYIQRQISLLLNVLFTPAPAPLE